MTVPEPKPTVEPGVTRFIGAALMAIGGLIAGLCGLCTVGFLIAGVSSPGGDGLIPLALVIGGIPTAIGVLLFVAGRGMRELGVAAGKPTNE